MWESGYSKKIGEREKHELVSKIPSYQVFTKADDGVEVVEQQVDRTHGEDKT